MGQVAEIMTPEHDLWKEFSEKLEGPEGCNVKKPQDAPMTWECAGGEDKENDFTFATAILQGMEGIDVEGSLEYFTENGGHCDCEILFNVGQ